MTRITILPVPTTSGEPAYFAVAGDKQSFGHSAGQALDALTEQLENEQESTLVIVQHLQADASWRSFSTNQRCIFTTKDTKKNGENVIFVELASTLAA